MNIVKLPALFFLLLVSAISCIHIEKLPPEPSIDFRSFEVFDTTDILGNEIKGGRLKFYFEDGDGDLGLPAPGPMSTDTVNLFITLFRKTSTGFVEAPPDDPLTPSDFRIPYMDRQGQNKILKGTISVTLLYLYYEQSDTIRYEFFIKDRADNESNTAITCTIIPYNNSMCTEEK
jgi:hypothetical protein